MSIFARRTPAAQAPQPEEQSWLTTALNTWNAPGSMLRGGIKESLAGGSFLEGAEKGRTLRDEGQVSTTDILKQQNILSDSPTLQAGAGFVGDILLDPLNFIPGKLIGNAVRGAAKVTGVTKGLDKLGQTAIMQDLGKKFIPHFETPKAMPLTGPAVNLREQKTLLGMRQGGAAHEGQQEIYNLLKGVTEADRKALPYIIEGTRQAANPLQAKAAQDVQAYLAKLAQREVDAGTLDPANVLQNYISYVLPKGTKQGKDVWYRSVSGKSRFSQPRELKSWDDALKAGAEADPLKALQVRAAVGGRAAATGEWVGDIATKFGQAAPVAKDWKKVTVPGIVETSALGQKLANTYFPPDVAQDLSRVLHYTDEGKGAVAETFDKLTGLWKTGVTSMNPGFHIRNFISNGWLMSTAGLSSIETANAMRKGTVAVLGGGKGMSKSTMDAAQKFGIFTGGHFGELQDAARSTLSKLNPLAGVARAGRAVGGKTESAARLGLFDHFIRKGLTPEEAAMKVRNHLFNYDELTDTEKNIRRFAIPFYTWMRKAGPLVAQSFIDNPKLWSRTNALTEALDAAAKGVGSFAEREPWEQENLQFPVGSGSLTMPNPFPVTELNRLGMPGEDKQRLAERTLSMLTPGLKIPIETLLMNKSLYTGFPIVKDPTFGTPENEATAMTPQTAYSTIGKGVGAVLGYKKDKQGRQMVPAGIDYAAQQIPFIGPSVLSPISAASESGVGGAVADVFGATSRSPKQVKERDERMAKKRASQAKAKRQADKSLHRLDRLANQVGAK